MGKHTPGPWIVNEDRDVWHTMGPGGQLVIAPTQEDARLIAAAPCLLEACQVAIEELTSARGGYPEWDRTPGRIQCAINELRQAIDKATGESQ